jgi:cytochrome c-type biogenesis protein CcsB
MRSIVCAFALMLGCAAESCLARSGSAEISFERAVDLQPLAELPVQSGGRIKSLGSFAQGEMGFISGPRLVNGQSPLFTYFDLLIRPEAYTDADVIYVKGGLVRQRIADAILREDPTLEERMRAFQSSGLISAALLGREGVAAVLEQMQGDLLRTAKVMDAVRGAQMLMQTDALLRGLRIVPPAPTDDRQRWHSISEVMLLAADAGAVKAAGKEALPVDGLDVGLQQQCAQQWRRMVEAWIDGDATRVNASVRALAAVLPTLNPIASPDPARLRWEAWYFASGNLSWIWLVYALSVILLLLAVVYRWPRARTAGLTIFALAFLMQTLALALRWWISDRFPNSNMFEAVTTSAWFGGCAAVFLEIAMRKRAVAGLVALASGFASSVALMAAHFLPVQLNAQISNMMPVLHDVWLYIHTNVIIFSYCLIFMAAVSAGLYLAYRALGGKRVYASVGGVSALSTEGVGGFRSERTGEVLDGVTMLLMKLSFILLWAGIAMGAIWADHSWGRPWGWDPKEVFALNTFVVFALLVHVRYRVQDKGVWTAVLAVVGAAVMLFNWIVINFVITGLHSYA